MHHKEIPSVLPQELSPSWSDLHQPADQPLSLHHGRGVGQLVPLGQAAGDARGCRALPGRDDDAHAIVAAASHGTTARIHHEADQEPARWTNNVREIKDKAIDRRHTTETNKEDNFHAVITVHQHKVRKREKLTKKEKETDRMIERRKKDALSSESLQFSLTPASIQNIKHCLKLNRVLLMKSQSLLSIHEAQGETFAKVSGPLKQHSVNKY